MFPTISRATDNGFVRQDGPMADLTSDHPTPVDDLLPDATRRLVRTADGLADDDYAAPSALPGWTRGHVLAHLALNAEGLSAALAGIVEGHPMPMYASQEARDTDIEELAGKEPTVIRTRLLGACTDLGDAIAAIPDDAWDTSIERTPGGRAFAAAAVPGMRLREVEIHHADLDAGYDRSGWPPAFAVLLLDGMAGRVGGTSGCTAYATDLDRSWDLGAGPTVSGTAADLGWWLTGRGGGEGLTSDSGELPHIEEW
jgi:maleylpyruvate isomerase